MGSSAASPLFSCALIDAFSPLSTSPVCALARSPLFGSLGRQTRVYIFPPRLPVGNVCCKRTPSQSLQQSPDMTPRGVVIMVTCTVSSTAHHLKPLHVTSAPATHMSQPSQPKRARAIAPVRVEDSPLTTWRTNDIDRGRGQRIMHERGGRLWH